MTEGIRKKLWIKQETDRVYRTNIYIYIYIYTNIYKKLYALYGKQFKTVVGTKKLKTVGYITPTMGHYPRDG